MSRKPETLRASRHFNFRGSLKGYGDNMAKIINLVGMRFGRLSVMERAENKGNHPAWTCKCDCGSMCVVTGTHLRSGHTLSCGCLQRERTSNARKSHGMGESRIYRIWANMKSRCFNSNAQFYQDYGGRGITVCDEWKDDFQAFYNWSILHGYSDELTIDRIDNDKGYSPGNCRWTTRKEQQNNRRNNHYITYNGETLTVTEWANRLGIGQKVLFARLNDYHWNIDEALKKTGL